jgi:predicted benzoate:H+ symporter BenE
MGFGFKIPADEAISAFELVFLLLFVSGLISTVNWLVMQYPNAGITLMGMGILLLWLAKMIRKKKAKLEAKK